MEHLTQAESDYSGEHDVLLPGGQVTPSDQKPDTYYLAIRVMLLAMATLNTLALQILVPAEIRIFESIYCKQWYQDNVSTLLSPLSGGPIDEHLCKKPPIQKQVSTLRRNIECWDAVSALILAIPFGILVDQVGRKWLLRLNLLTILPKTVWIRIVCANSMPLHNVCYASIMNVFCGGRVVAEMLFFVIITDITPRERLPTIFFLNNALGNLCVVVGSAVTGRLMRLDPWYSILCGFVLLLFASIVSFMVPETLKSMTHQEIDSLDSLRAPRMNISKRMGSILSACITSLTEIASFWMDWRLSVLPLLVLFRVMTSALVELSQRYVSYRYGWTLGEAAYLHSSQALLAAIVLMMILPWISTAMDKRGINAIRKHTILTELGLIFLALGFLVQGTVATVQLLKVGLVIQALGSGFPASMRALAGVLAEQEDNGRVISGLATLETLSTLFVYPLAAKLFNVGVEKGGKLWLGLPFYSTALTMVLATAGMCFLPFERPAGIRRRS